MMAYPQTSSAFAPKRHVSGVQVGVKSPADGIRIPGPLLSASVSGLGFRDMRAMQPP